jgi:hypothetical protein
MCGGFTCSKNTLVGLNVVYVLVSFLLIGVAVHGEFFKLFLGSKNLFSRSFRFAPFVSGRK